MAPDIPTHALDKIAFIAKIRNVTPHALLMRYIAAGLRYDADRDLSHGQVMQAGLTPDYLQSLRDYSGSAGENS